MKNYKCNLTPKLIHSFQSLMAAGKFTEQRPTKKKKLNILNTPKRNSEMLLEKNRRKTNSKQQKRLTKIEVPWKSSWAKCWSSRKPLYKSRLKWKENDRRAELFILKLNIHNRFKRPVFRPNNLGLTLAHHNIKVHNFPIS